MSDLIADLRKLQAALATMPPSSRCIKAHHSVPYGRAFKQWMTNGDLILWANRGEIADLPRRSAGEAPGPSLGAIPVVIEEEHNAD